MKVAYISGPYSADTPNGVYENIQRARRVACELLKQGYAFICPHLNTAFMDGLTTYEGFIAMDLALLERCDLIVMVPGWEKSGGSRTELGHAEKLGKEVMMAPEEWVK